MYISRLLSSRAFSFCSSHMLCLPAVKKQKTPCLFHVGRRGRARKESKKRMLNRKRHRGRRGAITNVVVHSLSGRNFKRHSENCTPSNESESRGANCKALDKLLPQATRLKSFLPPFLQLSAPLFLCWG